MDNFLDILLNEKWGSLTLDPHQDLPKIINFGSFRKYKFLCDCGRYCFISPNILTGKLKTNPNCRKTRTCGRCNWKTKEYWLTQKWGKIQLDLDQELSEEWAPQSNKFLKFKCDCGRSILNKFQTLTIGNSNSCNHCNDMSKGYWLAQRWGSRILNPDQEFPEEWSKSSNLRFWVLCDCGKKKWLLELG